MHHLRFGMLYLVGLLGCSPDVQGPNLPPVARAGGDILIEVNKTTSLDGTASFDPDGEPIKFQWELLYADPPQYSLVEITELRAAKAYITVKTEGFWIVRLTVNDGRLASIPDIVKVRTSQALPCMFDSDCDDHDACNGEETCVDNSCLRGTEPDCDDQNECTDDDCDPASGCTYSPNTAPCEDGDPCTINDACNQGVCTGMDKTSVSQAEGGCDDGNPCSLDSCDPLDGSCEHEGEGSCDDGDPCTINDYCDASGNCVGEDRATLPEEQGGCDRGDICLDAGCLPETGECQYTPNSEPCDDGDPCTKHDTCTEGTCLGTPYTCDDGNLCNGTETCSPADDTCLPGENLPETNLCVGDDLVICDGMGNEEGIINCLLGCNQTVDPNRCRVEITEGFGENNHPNHTNEYQGVTEDVSVDSEQPTTNFDTGYDYDGHNVNDDQFVWIRFDISALPDDAVIQTVKLFMFSQYREYQYWQPEQVYEVASAADSVPGNNWVETQATWETYDGSSGWTGGYDGGASDRGEVFAWATVPIEDVGMWVEWNFNSTGIAYVQGRLGGQVNLTVYGTVDTYRRQFMSSERDDGDRPLLRITYVW